MDEIRHYFDQPKLTCLLCGRQYALLSKHLNFTHDLAVNLYKEMYGLPWSRALAGVDYREVLGQRLRRTKALGRIPPRPPQEHIEKMQRGLALHHRPPVEAVRNAKRSRMLALDRPKRVLGSPERMEEYLRRIGTGRTPREVGGDGDMPCPKYFYLLCSQDPDYQRRYEALWDQLPFAVQIRGYKAGPRFKKTVKALRRSGKTWDEISRITGVNKVTVAHAWRRWTKSEQANSFTLKRAL